MSTMCGKARLADLFEARDDPYLGDSFRIPSEPQHDFRAGGSERTRPFFKNKERNTGLRINADRAAEEGLDNWLLASMGACYPQSWRPILVDVEKRRPLRPDSTTYRTLRRSRGGSLLWFEDSESPRARREERAGEPDDGVLLKELDGTLKCRARGGGDEFRLWNARNLSATDRRLPHRSGAC